MFVIAIKKHIDEKELVSRLQSKDTEALEYLYDSYSSALYGIICKIIPEEEIAKEVLQDLFLKIWEKIHKYEADKGRLFTWMLNVARNLALDKLRSAEYKHAHKSVSATDFVYTSETTPRTENNPEVLDMSDLLNRLKPEQKEIVELMYLKGYTQSEISEEFGIPLGTVKTRVKSAMNYLRSLF